MSFSGFRDVHSQIVTTRHPKARRPSSLFWSRSLVPENFVFQNVTFVDGLGRPMRQLCRCQKQP